MIGSLATGTSMRRGLSAVGALAAALAAPSPASADDVDTLVSDFVRAPGWQAQDVDAVDQRLLGLFAAAKPSAMRPDGEASPIEKALLLVDAMEPALPRVRVLVRYGQHVDDGTPYSFITVERYNMGPASHARTVADFGEENAASAKEFGIGPHVAWRVVTMPLMGNTAMLVDVSRREIPETEAQRADCLVGGCLDLSAMIDDYRNWQEQPREFGFASGYSPRGPEGFANHARAAAELSVAMWISQTDGNSAYWTGPEQPEAARGTEPFLFFYADNNAGQDWAIDSMLGQIMLNDDSIEATWERRLEFEGSLYWFAAADRR